MHANQHVSGNVVHTSTPSIQMGRYATIVRDGDTISVIQDGTTRGQWHADEARIDMALTQVPERYTPGWAIVLGILGIFFFLIGILFFLVKETRYVPRTTATVTVGGYPVVAIESMNAVLPPPAPVTA